MREKENRPRALRAEVGGAPRLSQSVLKGPVLDTCTLPRIGIGSGTYSVRAAISHNLWTQHFSEGKNMTTSLPLSRPAVIAAALARWPAALCRCRPSRRPARRARASVSNLAVTNSPTACRQSNTGKRCSSTVVAAAQYLRFLRPVLEGNPANPLSIPRIASAPL